MRLIRSSTLLSFLLAAPIPSFSAQLSLDNFLKQVEEKNQAVSASKLLIQSVDERSDEGKLIFRPNVFAQLQTAIDKKPTTNINAQGDRTDNDFMTAGILQQFNFGLQGKISYNLSHTHIYNSSPTFLPVNNFHDGVASVELSQSLWRNFWGKESRAQETIITSQAQALKHNENFKIQTTLSLAESIYWSLSQIRKVVKVQKDSLERALKIRTWTQNRLKSGLAESSDFLQADANYKDRTYQLKNSIQDLKNLQRSVNSLRGIDSDILDEELELVDSTKIKNLVLPAKVEFREDTKALLEIQNISKANTGLSIEKNKPTFEAYGIFSQSGRNPESDLAISKSFRTNNNTKVLGVRFVGPLDFETTNNNISGYQKEQIAAELNFQRKLFEQDQQWNDLTSRFEDAKIKLSLVEKIVEAQKLKANNERERLAKGRTVTFQVLNFEQEYAQSELARIQNETNILNIYSQLKIFGSHGGTR